MGADANPGGGRARLAEALLAIREARARLEAERQALHEPVAVIGLGCRYPGGVADADGFWRLLDAGRDAIGPVPADRWDADAYLTTDRDAPGGIVSREGGFLGPVDGFDPHFFGIAPREAAFLDPQHRLLLEVAWEAFEGAGLAADRLRGSRTGVFVGISGNEYAHLLAASGPKAIDPYTGSGNAHSVAAGRLSYTFGFEGPSLALDTACSSSLVAVHLACQSLRLGECDLALAGGVNVLLAPAVSINHSRAGMLAPDGRCKAFDARADGFVRSEGCGLVVLKPLARARADGDPILGILRGSAVNQDGRTSGLTVPSGPAQQAVIRCALAQAGLAPAALSYVEAHGTGTALGDPIELQALAGVFGDRGPGGAPLRVGSVKANIGHAEAAAGIAGLIKVLLALRHGRIPANLHFREPNPRFAWAGSGLAVPVASTPWPAGDGPRIAGVSSFGFGGTNAHVVVEEPPPRPEPDGAASPDRQLLVLSARSEPALQALAGRWAEALAASPEGRLADLCHTARTGRAGLTHRLAVAGTDAGSLRAALEACAAGGGAGFRGRAVPGRPPTVAFLFTGQGSQYPGMGAGLAAADPGFRSELAECAGLLAPHLDRPLLDLLHAVPGDGALDRTGPAQPALFALEVCLGRLWMRWGVTPDFLLGHSLGAYAAACLAGVFSLEDGLRLVVARGRLMEAMPGDGAMAALLADEGTVRRAIAAAAPGIAVAALNGPEHVVVSGERAGVDALLAHLAERGIGAHPLPGSRAFHSALIKPMLAEFEGAAGAVAFALPRLGLVSDLTGRLAGAEVATPGYWCRHAREPVRFRDGLRTLEDQRTEIFLEVGPQPVLTGLGRACAARPATWLPSLRRGRDDHAVILDTLAALWVLGAPVDWAAVDAPYALRRVAGPTYPFERKRYWAAPRPEAPVRPGRSRPASEGGRSLPVVNGEAGLAAPPFANDPALHAGAAPEDGAPEFVALRWIARPRAAAPPSPAELAAGLRPHLAAAMADPAVIAYAEALAGLDALAPGYVAAALRELGWRHRPGERVRDAALRRALGVIPERAGAFGRLLEILAAHGVLCRSGDGWEVLADLPEMDATGEALFAAAPEEYRLLRAAAARLPDVLAGRCDPVKILFGEDGRRSADAVYGGSPGAAAMHGLLARAAAALGAGRPADAPLRVLEIGAGTGGATAHVVPVLPPGTEYVFTDLSRSFLAEARGRFADYGLRYEVLDIERDPDAQGFSGRSFDLVIAFNVLHATRDLAETLGHVRRLLASGGTLLLSESTAPAPWADLIWGLTPGWWRFRDRDLRPHHPLLDAAAWCRFLSGQGFDGAEAVAADPETQPVMARQALIVARAERVSAPAPRRNWLILPDEAGVGEALARLIEAGGDRAIRVGRALDRLSGEGERPHAIVDLRGLDASESAEMAPEALAAEAVALASGAVALAGLPADPGAAPRLWIVTRGVEAAGDAPPERLGAAPLRGIGLTIARERPEIWGGLIDLDRDPRPDDAARVLVEIVDPDGEDVIALRPDGRRVARIAPVAPPAASPPSVRGEGTYLVAGGCGALGLRTARWLADRGARHLVLVGRSPPGPVARAAVEALERRGVAVAIRRADVADAEAMGAILAAIRDGGRTLRGVFHAAGLPGHQALADLDAQALAEMFSAKVAGGWVLHRLTREAPLDLFVCFSSMVSLWGARGQAHYVAANGFLDALVLHRRALGLPGLCVNWGPLRGGGMLPEADVDPLRRIGVVATPLEGAEDTLDRLVGSPLAQAAPVRIDWPTFRAAYGARGACRLFEEMGADSGSRPIKVPAAAPPAPVVERLDRAPEGERRAILDEHLRATLGGVLGLEAGHAVDGRQGFFDLGMDSLTAMEFRTRLQASLAVELPPTLVFDHGTLDGLADFLARAVPAARPGEPALAGPSIP